MVLGCCVHENRALLTHSSVCFAFLDRSGSAKDKNHVIIEVKEIVIGDHIQRSPEEILKILPKKWHGFEYLP